MNALRTVAALILTGVVLALAVAFQQPRSPEPAPPHHPAPAPLTTAPPRYWKGNLHTHTLWSDGDDFPEMVVEWYKQHGYNFLSLTEHNVLAEGSRWVAADSSPTRQLAVRKYLRRFGERWVEFRQQNGQSQVRLKPLAEFRPLVDEPGRFLLIPGEEITHSFAKRPIHINAINLRDPIQPIDGQDAIETIRVNLRQVAQQRAKTHQVMIAFLNHPNFGWGVRAEEMLKAEELRFFEVYNGHPAVRNYGDAHHASTERVWDITLARRLGQYKLSIVYGLATDDSHGYHQFGIGQVNPGRGWVMVKAPVLTPENIVKALEAGDFYATTGVLLDTIDRDEKQLHLTIRTEPGVRYTTQFIATMKDADLTATPKTFKDKSGAEVPVTSDYSPAIGQVVATSTAANPRYTFTGKELYVRAKIISTKPHPNPYADGDVEVAWTQPVVP
ncbi:MAG: hypothetical protein RMJ56_14140 [Gemmataceae bacterium]|nr:hypothetical protein [Gemmata sp.]MDW8198733.1 hypothetical protein [Gemmataceae bacterium]